jgi:hypothetical protein
MFQNHPYGDVMPVSLPLELEQLADRALPVDRRRSATKPCGPSGVPAAALPGFPSIASAVQGSCPATMIERAGRAEYAGSKGYRKCLQFHRFSPQIHLTGLPHTQAFTFLITALVLIITVLAIRGPLKENTRTREQELVQKRFGKNALTLLRIVGGVSDLKVNGKASAELQLSALVALENYPEYHGVFEYLLSFYKSDPTKADYDTQSLSPSLTD